MSKRKTKSKTILKKIIRHQRPKTRGNGMGSLYQIHNKGNWQMAYFDASGKRIIESSGSTQKSFASRVLAQRVKEVLEEKFGLISPSDKLLLTSRKKDISEYLREYLKWCEKGKENPETRQGLNQKSSHLHEWIQYQPIQNIADINEKGLLDFLENRQSHTKGRGGKPTTGARVWNIVRQHAIVFANWLVKKGYLKGNPLLNVLRKKEDKDRRRQRRAFTDQEIKNLLVVARPRGRECWYRCAAEIGLRKSDLQRLLWNKIVWAKDGSATLYIKDQKSKNREDLLPVGNYLAELLRNRFKEQGEKSNGKVFPQTVRDLTRRKDFKRAGIKEFDSAGRVCDLHSFRMTLATKLVSSEAPLATIQLLLRHKNIETTLQFYNDANSKTAMEAKRKWSQKANPWALTF